MSTVHKEDLGALVADRRWTSRLVETLISDSRDALLVLDEKEIVVDASPEWQVLCGGRRDELVGRSFAEVVDGGQGCELADLLRRAQSERRPVEGIVSQRHRHGFALTLAACVTPIAAQGATVGGYLVRLRPPPSSGG